MVGGPASPKGPGGRVCGRPTTRPARPFPDRSLGPGRGAVVLVTASEGRARSGAGWARPLWACEGRRSTARTPREVPPWQAALLLFEPAARGWVPPPAWWRSPFAHRVLLWNEAGTVYIS
eukprot:scaffold3410_cov398-Prasinococcus_capsulatus_cf.AAC.9